MKRKSARHLVLGGAAFVSLTVAVSQERPALGLVSYDDFETIEVPPGGALDEAALALDYFPEDAPFGLRSDLNGDGEAEFFLGSPGYRLCGTAGCPYFLIDGASREIIGEFFGTIVVTGEKINRYPVIQSISKRDIETTNLQVYVFADDRYAEVSHALLESGGMTEWWDFVLALGAPEE